MFIHGGISVAVDPILKRQDETPEHCLTILGHQVMTEHVVQASKLCIEPLASLELIGCKSLSVVDSFRNKGTFKQLINQDKSWECATTTLIATEDLNKLGKFIYDYLDDECSPVLRIETSQNFINQGTMDLKFGGTHPPSTELNGRDQPFQQADVTISPRLVFLNLGTIKILGTLTHMVRAVMEVLFPRSKRPTFFNHGTICLENASWYAAQGVHGIGNIVVGSGSRVHVSSNDVYDREQIFYMDPRDSTATLSIEVAAYSCRLGLRVSNLSKGCRITFSKPFGYAYFDESRSAFLFTESVSPQLKPTVVISTDRLILADEFTFDGTTLEVLKSPLPRTTPTWAC